MKEPLTRELRERLTSEVFHRDLVLDLRAADEEARTVPASMSSETPVRRWFGNEILSHEPSAVNLERVTGGALPLLWGHDTDDLLGAAEGFRLEGGVLRGQLRFSKHATRAEVWEQIREGMPLGISIGYRVDEWKETADSDDVTVTRWTLHEVSVVTVPADHTVGIGRSLDMEAQNMSDSQAGQTGVPATVPAVDTGPAHVRLVQAKGREEGRNEERQRIAAIRELFVLPGFQTDDHIALREWAIDSGASVEQCREELLKMAGSGVSPVATLPPVQRQAPQFAGPGGYQEYPFGRDSQIRVNAGADQRDKFAEGAMRAIELRTGSVKDVAKQAEYREGNEFVGMTLIEMARASLVRQGVNTAGMDQRTLVGLALTHQGSFVRGGAIISHGTSDFANLLLDAANKWLVGGYTEAPETWRPFCKVVSISDFKPMNMLNRSNFGDLDVIPEHAEYKYGTMSDTKETITLRTYGKAFSISRQAIINDDLAAFTEVPMLMGRAAARMVGDEAYAVLTGNPTLAQDSTALFHTSHNNIWTTTNAGAPSVTTMDVHNRYTATQTDPSGATINLSPRYLVCGHALVGTARALATALYDPAGTAGTLKPNVWQGRFDVIADARIDAFNAAGWFTLCDPNQLPTVVVGFLNGNETPYMEQENPFSQDGVAFKVRIDVRAAAADFRGAQYNDGVA